MEGGYYNHESLAIEIQSAIGQRKRLLELGIGTGKLAQELLKLDPTYELTGIDFSSAMVEIAKNRLPDRVSVIECDVATMHLDRRFDAAVSSGGTWVLSRLDDEMFLGTHLFDTEKDIRGLKNVAEHLDPGGLLVLSLHSFHEDRDVNLADGIVYSQKIGSRNGSPDRFSIEKNYCFRRDGNILAEETLTLGFYGSSVFLKMLADVGFKPLGPNKTETFFVFEKKN
ncbi:MAG: class I SAM-dependent methyltransferase [Cyanobacteriota bacterium]|nr:class I SAM-dependent methyltransferase [Cyanobacteriota bacterium]